MSTSQQPVQHNKVFDNTSSGYPRWSCDCGAVLVRQPWMTDMVWYHKENSFNRGGYCAIKSLADALFLKEERPPIKEELPPHIALMEEFRLALHDILSYLDESQCPVCIRARTDIVSRVTSRMWAVTHKRNAGMAGSPDQALLRSGCPACQEGCPTEALRPAHEDTQIRQEDRL